MAELIGMELGGDETLCSHPAKGNFFGWTLTISLLLHLAAGAFLLAGSTGVGLPQVTYIDLGMPHPSSPLPAKPAHLKAPPPVAEPDAPVAEPAPAEEPAPSADKPADAAGDNRPLQQNALALGMNYGFFRSFAEGESLRHEIREYYLNMLQMINESWWMIGGADPRGVRQDASVVVRIARNGDIVDLKMVRGSGSAAYDRTILRALDVAAPFPPLPESYPGFYFEAPLRLVAPTGLMLAGAPQESHAR